MPNYVYNALKFQYLPDGNIDEVSQYNGEKIDVIRKTLKNHNIHTCLDFSKIIPEPENVKAFFSDILTEDALYWRLENWGTKSNALNAEIKAFNRWKLIIHFKTTWNIPKPIIDTLIEMFPDVTIQFISVEEGCDFAYHIIKYPDEDINIKLWNDETDIDRSIRKALIQAINLNEDEWL